MSRSGQVKVFLGFLTLAAVLVAAGPLGADGFIVPWHQGREVIPPLTVKYHHVTVEILNQVAKTSVDQVFINNHDQAIEGRYIFPLPEGAAISEFAMWIGDQKVEGEILDSVKARGIYEDIVRRLRDPALLEYVGRNLFQARVFPIPARGEKRIRLAYTQVLKAERDLVKYLYPLNTEKFSRDPLQDVSVSVRIDSPSPILNVYSPSHRVSVRRDGERKAQVGYEDRNVRPDKDFVLYYSFTRDEVGLSFVNWEGEDGRFFLLLAAPRYAAERERVIDKNLVLVLDSSGSMSGTKIRQAKDAARFVINHLEERDRFSLIDFDDGVTLLAETLVPATAANRDKALKFVDEIQDSGGTNVNDALLRALRLLEPGGRPNYVLFLTDGLPTVGTTEVAEILKNVAAGNKAKGRVFVFGVGNDVNTELLDKVAADHRGVPVYVSETEDLEVALSSYYEKIASPLLADLSLSYRGIEVSQAYPRTLPDLFKGSQLVVVGKYAGEGPVAITLGGRVGPKDRTFTAEGLKLVRDETYNFLPRLWATRRIGYLLEEVRMRGESNELVEEVKKLALKHGIVTPYTSYLVTERERVHLEAAAPAAQEAMAGRQVTGAGAVKASKVAASFKDKERADEVVSEQIRYKENKTFYAKDGVWVDSAYKEGSPVVEVKFNSDEYFKLLAEKPALAKFLSVGTKVVVVLDGVNYKIVE
jgi:Ca-activated chloride channel family protein